MSFADLLPSQAETVERYPALNRSKHDPVRAALIELISAIIIVGFAMSVFYHFIRGVYGGEGYPYNSFLFRPDDHFNDFKNGLRAIDHAFGGPGWDPEFRHPIWQVANAWPFMNAFHYLFLPLGLRWGTIVWLSVFILVFFTWSARHLKGPSTIGTLRDAFVFSFLTYPFLYALDRANPEVFVFVFLAAFYRFYGTPHHAFGLVALAAAIAMKVFPAVYLILLVCDRRFVQAILTGSLAIGFNLAAAAILPGGFVANMDRWLFQHAKVYQGLMAVGSEGMIFGNSLWGAGGMVLSELHAARSSGNIEKVLASLQLPYLLVALTLFAALLFYLVRFEKIWWRRATLLAFAMLLLPYVSADYRLLHVYFPLFMFLNSDQRGRFAPFYAVMFALLLIPKDYIHFPHFKEASIQIVLNPLIMLAMGAGIIWEGLTTNLPGRRAPGVAGA